MQNLKKIFIAIWTIIAGMYGGQKKKGVRRLGIPIPAFLMALTDGFDWRDLSFLVLIPLLSLGYGESSFLTHIFGSDSIVRLVYGLLISAPFYAYGLRRGMAASIAMILAFQVRAGSLGSVSWFGDFLIEDIIRYGALGVLIAFNMFFKKGGEK